MWKGGVEKDSCRSFQGKSSSLFSRFLFLFVCTLQEESLVEREDDLERREQENEESISIFRLERQKEALRMLVGRRRHEEREIVSAAFSKWV